jgi:hypothetical protein
LTNHADGVDPVAALDDRRFEDVDCDVVVVMGDVMEKKDVARNFDQRQQTSHCRKYGN